MRPNELWEDPFSEQDGRRRSEPTFFPTGVFAYVRDEILWTPGMPLPLSELKKIPKTFGIKGPDVNLKVIRGRQERLLPHIEEIQNAAKEVVGNFGSVQKPDTQHLKDIAQRDVTVCVFYRYPDQPDLLTFLGVTISDHAIVLPVDKQLKPPVLDYLFPMQRVTEDSGDMIRQQTIAKAREELNLTKREGLASNPMTPNRVVVYPKLLDFTSKWIQGVESPIFDIWYQERTGEANYETDRSMAKRKALPRKTPQVN